MLFGEVDGKLKLDAARIYVAGIYPQLLSLPQGRRPENSVKMWLETLVEENENYVTVVAADSEGKVVALYQLWPFSKQNGCLENSSYGYLMAEPRGEGIGSEVLQCLTPIFEHLAYVTGSSAVRHEVMSKSTLFQRNGYTLFGHNPADNQPLWERRYLPKEHVLSASEQRITEALRAKMLA